MTFKKAFVSLILVPLCAVFLGAQQQGGEGGTTTDGGGRGSPGTPGVGQPTQPGQSRQQNPFGQQQQRQRMPDYQRQIFLTGQVMLDDGTPPPEPVIVERVCHGRNYPEGYTNSKGHFSIRLGGDPTLAMSDASVAGVSGLEGGGGSTAQDPFGPGLGVGTQDSSAMGRVDLTGCELRAKLPGYQSDVVQLGRRSVFDNPKIGTIVLHRLANVEGTSISMTTLAAPKKAKKAYEKAFKETRKPKPKLDKVAKELEKAVGIYPEYAAAWSLLGEVRLRTKDIDGARQAFQKALDADDKYLNPYPSLMRLALQQGQWEEVDKLSTTVLRLNPQWTEAQYYRAVATFNMGDMEAAEQSVNAVRSSKESHQFPQAHHLLGLIHAKQGKFETAAGELRSYLMAQPNSPIAGDIQRQLTEWEALGVIKSAEAPSAAAQQ